MERLRHIIAPNAVKTTARAVRIKYVDDPNPPKRDWVELWFALVFVVVVGPIVTEESDDTAVVVVVVVVTIGGKGRPATVVRRRTVNVVAPELPTLSASPP